MLSKNQLGFLYMFLSVCAFSAMDLIVKWSENYPVGEVLFFRGLCGIIPLFFFMPKEKYFDFYKSSRGLLHLKRGNTKVISLIEEVMNFKIHEKVKVKFNANKFYAFDENENLVSSPYGALNG